MSRIDFLQATIRKFISHPSPEGTISGAYPLQNAEKQIGAVVLQEFGSDPSLRPNQEIVDYYMQLGEDIQALPLFVSGSIASTLRERKLREPNFVFEGESATNSGEGLGTYGELAQLNNHISKFGVEEDNKILIISQAYNVSNILRQARIFRLPVATHNDYPTSFDRRSSQLWTKHWALWALTSRLRIAILRAKGH